MIKKNLFLPIFLIFIQLIVTFTANAQSESKQKLIALEKERFQALTSRDTSTLSRLLSDDLVYIHSNGEIDTKSSLLKNLGTGSIVYLFFIPEKTTATIQGNVGWVYGTANIRFKVASINMTIDQYISFIDFYRLNHQQQWQLVACQNARVNKDNPYYINPRDQVKPAPQPSIY